MNIATQNVCNLTECELYKEDTLSSNYSSVLTGGSNNFLVMGLSASLILQPLRKPQWRWKPICTCVHLAYI